LSKPLRVLIVEDSEDDTLLLIRQLRKDGYDPVFERVDNAAAMRTVLDKQPWDIVISDFVMPQFGGLEALELLQDKGLDIPFIIVSGKIGEDTAVSAMRAGAYDYIMKDNLKRLGAAIERELADAENRRERRRAEERVRRNEVQLRQLFETMVEGVLLISADGRILRANPAAIELLKVDRSEDPRGGFRFPPDLKLLRYDGTPMPAEERALSRAINEKRIIKNIPTGIEFSDGSFRWFQTSAAPLTDEAGNIVAVVDTFADITEVREAEDKLKAEHEDRLRAYERLANLGRLAGSIAHELRNPLATVDSSATYLMATLKDADSKTRVHLERIRLGVDRAVAIIQELLDQARMREPQLVRLGLKDFVSQLLADAELPKTVRVAREFPEWEIEVMADREQLRIALSNIIKNAVEAMDKKGTLGIRIRSADGEAEISFADTGHGIAPENRDKIFQPLFTTKATGVGLGLTIAKTIIERHRGTIGVQTPDKGTVFVIRLPVD
jgi:two-component system cell cycle sensor histidine kinase/response regulator CckA